MKIFVRRNQFLTFQKAKIEFTDSREWGIISSSLKTELESTVESIRFFEKLKNENSEHYNFNDHQWYIERKEKLEEMIESLKRENEKSWR